MKATIVGTITDSSGATVAGAQVTIRNLDTNVPSTLTSDASGEYVVPFLDPGRYSVSAEKSGFKIAVEPEVKVDVAATVRIDLRLQVGSTSERVEVSAAAPLVQSDSSDVGLVVTTRELTQLPLLGRNFETLSQLSPTAVTPVTNPTTQFMPGLTTGSYYQVAGQRGAYTVYTFDGIETNNWMGYQSSGILPSLDTIEEYKVITHNASAEYGRSSVQFAASTRAGTNQLHGSAYEYLRNNILNANDFFSNEAGKAISAFRYNQFGVTVGGPIVLPKLYHGQDRTFFFFGYEGTRYVFDNNTFGEFPNPAWLTGNFTGSATIYDPTSVVSNGNGGYVRSPFAGNVIPTTKFDPVAAAAIQYIPKPGSLANIIPGSNTAVVAPTISAPNQYVARVDQNFSSKDRMYGRYMQSRERETIASIVPLSGSINVNHGYNGMIAETHVFSPTLVNEVRLGFNRANYGSYQEGGSIAGCISACTPTNIAEDVLHLSNIGIGSAGYGIPDLSFTGYTAVGGPVNDPFLLVTNTYEVLDNLMWTKGRHAIKMGFSYGHVTDFYESPSAARGSFAFSGQYTQGLAAGQSNTGNPFADFLLGYATSATGLAGTPSGHFRTGYQGYYFQDDFRVNSRLTLNLGLRWEYYTPYSPAGSSTSAEFVFGFPFGSCFGSGCPPGYIKQISPGQELYKKNWNDWAPRVGFAYSPFGNSKTVIRSAFGIFYSPTDGTWAGGVGVLNPPTSLVFQESPLNPYTDLTTTKMSNQFPSAVIPPVSQLTTSKWPLPAISIYTQMPVEKDGAVDQWEFSVQHGFGSNIVLEAGYIGSHSYHGQRVIDPNQARLDYPGMLTSITSRLPYPALSSITPTVIHVGTSAYEAGFLRAEERFSHGLSFTAAYTYSKSTDDYGNTNAPDEQFPEYTYNLSLEHGLSYFDARQRLSLGYVWELPFGRGRYFGSNMSRVWDALFGGWETSSIAIFQSGTPVVLGVVGLPSNTGSSGGGRPDVVGAVQYLDPKTTGYWFNGSAFMLPPTGTLGNAARGAVIGPGVNNWDMTASKNFHIRERVIMQFRGEFFNAFNHTQFLAVTGTIGTTVVAKEGQVTSTRSPRNVQLAVRFQF